MSFDDLIPDRYTRTARISPFFILAIPLGLAVFVWFPDKFQEWKSALGSTAIWAIASLVISQIVRDAGSRKQEYLFKKWGGVPTTRLLRHRDASNSILLSRHHRKLEKLLSEESEPFSLPQQEEELSNPIDADKKYETCVSYLKSKTRDAEKFKLLHTENRSYGFRRNLWGLKKIGIALCIVSSLFISYKIWDTYKTSQIAIEDVALLIVSVVILFMWFFIFNENWVKEAANRYAQTLINSCENF